MKITKYMIIRILMITGMSFLALFAIFPFFMMLNMGTYYANDLYTGLKMVPGNYFFGNLKALQQIPLLRYYFNSFYVATTSSVLATLVCSMAGFAFAKYKFRFKNPLFAVVLLSIMIPVQLSLVGFMLEMRVIGWLNSLLPLIIPPAANAFGAFWMTQYAKNSIPDSVIESAKIDGCNDFKVFFQIAFPFLRPAATTLIMLIFFQSWNNFLLPLIIISDNKLYTIQLGIRQLSSQYHSDIGAQILGISFGTFPMLLVFIILSKYLISGLAAAAVKE